MNPDPIEPTPDQVRYLTHYPRHRQPWRAGESQFEPALGKYHPVEVQSGDGRTVTHIETFAPKHLTAKPTRDL